MKYYSLLLLVIGCATTTVPPQIEVTQPPVVVETVKTALEIVNASDPSKYPETAHWSPDYEAIVLATLKEYPVKKLPCDPIVTFKGIVNAESGFKKSSRYLESFGVYSIGLMQLSVSDEKRYFCGFKTEADVINPIRNLYCGVKVFNTLENKYPNENFYEYGGRYFSTLRWNKFAKWEGKTQSGWERVRKYWSNLGCEIK